ncbi:DMT family transporter [Mycolicibacterium vaccae]|jgi:quaternary ammonium compound-resistance protein SugE|uniref:Cation/cationic drug transporter n=1 Tax=Mycolicibacterium vaccae ATCC 25954 TaxID=1194972 RepID=K0ULU1_MYCVA|nr:multidrug efflux SMR transporter [Mycolicibacterium vaccae]ANI38018.1 ligand-binding protein SH3 [Mycolicibacterium vaccae 95051]EJZ07791.1 cation/cationic drug transporter [Mycolicibacterium vaccae ATCC 25954]
MPWAILILSAVLEAVWATALGASDGLREPVPTAVFAVAALASIIGLGWAAKHIPIGTAYAVWTGLGAALTVGYAMVTGVEAVSLGKLVFLGGIIVAVVGLQMLPSGAAARDDADPRPPVLERSGR